MLHTVQHLNALYVIVLALSALLFLYLRTLWSKKVPEIFFWTHFTIVSWSALMYLNLVFDSPVSPFTYYADWIVSTPLIMLALGLTAMYPLQKIEWSLLFPLMMAQAMVVVTGLLAQISHSQTSMLYFFCFGNLLMLVIFYLVFGPLMQLAHSNTMLLQKYKNLAWLLVAFWISYPIVWIIGTPGYGLISPYTTNLLFIILPILCKPVFGIIDLYIIQSLKHNKVKN